MFSIFAVLFVLCKISMAAVIPEEKDAIILDYKNNYGSRDYKFSYSTSNGITRSETGMLVNAGQDNEHIAVQGFFSYIDPDGTPRLVHYIADENGYRVMESNVEAVKPDEINVQVSSQVLASLLG